MTLSYKQIANFLSLFGIAITIVFLIWSWQQGILTSQDKMQAFLGGFGAAAGIVFILLQIVQVVIPIIPAGLGCVAGVLIFGASMGFVYNYIGICIGSVIVFLISKHYGKPLMEIMFDQKLITRYENWTEENHRFTKLFAAAIFFPVAPDDFLCYLAGTTKMKLSTFTTIILLGKPLSIAIYSMGLNFILQSLFKLLPAI